MCRLIKGGLLLIMINQERRALLLDHLQDTILRLVLHCVIFGSLVWLVFFNHSSLFTDLNARQILTRERLRLFFIFLYPISYFPLLLRDIRLLVQLTLDLAMRQTRTGNFRERYGLGPYRFVLSKTKRYLLTVPSWEKDKREERQFRIERRKPHQKKQKKSRIQKICHRFQSWFKDWVDFTIASYKTAFWSLVLDGSVCDVVKAEGLLQSANGGKSYIYTAARFSGVVFEFYAERNPERVWSISPERDTSESVPPAPQGKK